jgi:hypothetical protein
VDIHTYNAYIDKWDALSKVRDTGVALASIPWPVETGKKNSMGEQDNHRSTL